MMIVWFGESPSLFRDHAFVRVRYTEAPGVAEGIPVRKSGIRIGEVAVDHVRRPARQPDGVIVDLALERKYKIKKDSVPRITRSLIGDVAIDMLPGTSTEVTSDRQDPRPAPRSSATSRPTLPRPSPRPPPPSRRSEGPSSRSRGRRRVRLVAKKAEHLDEFLAPRRHRQEHLEGRQGDRPGHRRERGRPEAGDRQPPQGRAEAQRARSIRRPRRRSRAGINRFSAAAARLDSGLAELDPAFKDLGSQGQPRADHRHRPGRPPHQPGRRRSRRLLTSKLRNGRRPAQHRREPPEADHPERVARQPQPDGGLGHPGPGPAQDGPGLAAGIRREGLLGPGHADPRCVPAAVGRASQSRRSVVAVPATESDGLLRTNPSEVIDRTEPTHADLSPARLSRNSSRRWAG